MTKKEKAKMYRHGEIGLKPINKLPSGLTKSNSKIIVTGSHGNSHSIDNGTLYFRQVNDYVFGYLVAEKTKLLHAEHGVVVSENQPAEAEIPDGIYELYKQQEFINNEMRPVID